MMVRLQKFMAEAGVASRRASEEFIREGRVQVNGAVVAVLGTKIDPLHDEVRLDGMRLKPRRKLYIAVHKPRGYLCSRSDPQRRQIIAELLPKEWTNLYTVGRLDRDSEGLILMTNDGEFCLRVSHPRYGIRKVYRVTVRGRVASDLVPKLEKGVQVGGERLHADRARLLKTHQNGSVLELELSEGKNREVRRLLEALGIEVELLQRIRIGSLRLGELPAGRWRTLTEPEIKSLLVSI
jgi:23S rRNA pseudouridine2605 synthase